MNPAVVSEVTPKVPSTPKRWPAPTTMLPEKSLLRVSDRHAILRPYTGIGDLMLPALVAAGVGTVPGSEQPNVPNPFESRSWPSRAPGSERPYRLD